MRKSSSACLHGLYLTICVVGAAVGSYFGVESGDFKGRFNLRPVSGFDSQLSFSQMEGSVTHPTGVKHKTPHPYPPSEGEEKKEARPPTAN